LGKREKFSVNSLAKAAAKAARAVRSIKRDSFAIVVPDHEALHVEEMATAIAEGTVLGLHLFNDFKTDEDTKTLTTIGTVTLFASDTEAATRGAEYAQITTAANLRARHWVNLPSNRKSPQFLAMEAQKIAEEGGLRCEVWDENKIREERMGALYAVGMGSDNQPRLIVLEHAPEGHENDAPLILVGKGMTFDSGGLSIKPAQSMEDMKDDMAGAAVVLGVMSAVGHLKPARRIIGIVASAENMINGRAQRPGDIVTARNGKTIEVLNTDAEGRLILADALSYACELEPEAILDFATLTGAIGIALGQEAAGIFSNNGELEVKVQAAGERVGERLWPFPMWDEYKEHVKGTVSDLKNMGLERRAGSIAGAVFLENFVSDDIPWAHLDIAAVSLLRDSRPLTARGATGFGVRLVLEFLRDKV
jgi:leucyl aminopeptidase